MTATLYQRVAPDEVEEESSSEEQDADECFYRGKSGSSEGELDVPALLCDLALPSPQVLRATAASVPLRHCGALMRSSTGSEVARGHSKDCYDLSFDVDRIDHFWSHSWHGPGWAKLFVLLLHYNSKGAFAGGLCGSAAGAFIVYSTASVDNVDICSTLTLMLGCVGFALGLLHSCSNWHIFLEKVCICQVDPKLKAKGIAGIGGYLRLSDCMLILWDSTYFQRLWCVFELTGFAFLRMHDDSKRIVVRPTFQGPIVLSGMCFSCFLCAFTRAIVYLHAAGLVSPFTARHVVELTSFVAMWIFAYRIRGCAKDSVRVSQQIASFSFSYAECFCCSCNHCHPDSGYEIACDREVVFNALMTWFGSVERAEHFLHDRIMPCFRVTVGLPYRKAVLIGIPVLYHSMGEWAWVSLNGAEEDLLSDFAAVCYGGTHRLVVFRLIAVFFGFPLLIEVVTRAAIFLNHHALSRFGDLVCSLVVTFVGFSFGLLYSLANIFVHRQLGCALEAYIVMMFMNLLATLLAYGKRTIS